MLIGAHVSPAGGPAKAVERGEEQRRRGDPDLQPEPAGLEADRLRRRAGRGLPRGDGREQEGRRRCSSTPSTCSTRPPRTREIRDKTLHLADRLAAGRRRARRARRRAAPRLGQDGRRRRRRSSAPAKVIARGARRRASAARCTWRTPRAPAGRWAARSPSSRRCSTPPAAASGWASAWTPATCWPPASTSAPPRGSRRCSTTSTPSVGLRAAGLAAPQRQPDAAGLQPRPPRARGQGRARRRGLRRVPVRAALRGPALRAGDAGSPTAPTPRSCAGRGALRKRGLEARA